MFAEINVCLVLFIGKIFKGSNLAINYKSLYIYKKQNIVFIIMNTTLRCKRMKLLLS